MKAVVGGRAYSLGTDIQNNTAQRQSFNALAMQTFGISFEQWHQAGYWGGQYRPYALLAGETVVANASVNVMDFVWQGAARRYIQLGTVMTAPAYRNKGLAAFLLKTIMEEWRHQCDAMYLYANGSVLGFYPRFGFVQAYEYTARRHVAQRNAPVRRLNMEIGEDTALLHEFYRKSNPFSRLAMVNNWGLLMFYCGGPLKDCVYLVEDCPAVVIAQPSGGALLVYDIYCGVGVSLAQVLGPLAANAPGGEVQLGFAWKDAPESSLHMLQEEDTALFVLAGRENLFQSHKTMFPLLSHA